MKLQTEIGKIKGKTIDVFLHGEMVWTSLWGIPLAKKYLKLKIKIKHETDKKVIFYCDDESNHNVLWE